MDKCYWQADFPGSDTYQTSCGNLFTINDGSPEENEMKFCCYCGRDLIEEPATIEES